MRQLLVTVVWFLHWIPVYAPGVTAQAFEPVNVLTWWGYLSSSNLLNEIEHKCSARVSYDEFYSTTEFLRRFDSPKTAYDIILYSDTAHKLIHSKINKKGNSLQSLRKAYHPSIATAVERLNYPSNVAPISLTSSGFLYNPTHLEIDPEDSVRDIFKAARGKEILLLDDYEEIKALLIQAFPHESIDNSNFINYMNQLTKDTTLYFTNEIETLAKRRNFAFAYTWSGEAFFHIQHHDKSHRFKVVESGQYLTADVLALLTNKRAATCVAKAVAGNTFLKDIQNKDYYFSPYAPFPTPSSPQGFQTLYSLVFNARSSFKWNPQKAHTTSKDARSIWKKLKLQLMESR